jgi:hypothetical protein
VTDMIDIWILVALVIAALVAGRGPGTRAHSR